MEGEQAAYKGNECKDYPEDPDQDSGKTDYDDDYKNDTFVNKDEEAYEEMLDSGYKEEDYDENYSA